MQAATQLKHEYGFGLKADLANDYEAVIITVPHKTYANMDDAAFLLSRSQMQLLQI